MDREKALAKIKKCLALAKSSNPHEAAAAMRQAQILMSQHNISETDLSLADVGESAVSARLNAATPWETHLVQMIAEAFGCSYLSQSIRYLTASHAVARKREYIFIGVGSAPEVAGYAFNVLARQCAKDRLEHIRRQPKSCKPITKTARGDEFALGWVAGVRRLVQMFSGSERSQHLIDQYIATKYPDLETRDVKDRAKGRNVSLNDRYEGMAAGRKAKLDRGVGNTRQQDLLAYS